MKRALHLLGLNWKALVEFELVYKLFTTATAFPLFWAIFRGIMRLRGYRYLTSENFLTFMVHPVTILFVAGLFLLMTAYAMIDIGAIIYIMEESRKERTATFFRTLVFSVKNALRVFRRGNAMLILVVIFMLPLIQFGVLTGFLGTLTLPDFIMAQIYEHWYWMLFFFGGIAALIYVLMRWFFAFHYFTLEGTNFKESRKRSLILSKGNKLQNLLIYGGMQLTVWAIYQLTAGIGVTIITLLTRAFSGQVLIKSLLSGSLGGFLLAAMIVISCMQTPATYVLLSLLFYRRKRQKGEPMPEIEEPVTHPHPKLRRLVTILEGVAIAVCVFVCCVYGYGVQIGRFRATETVEVTAHRGASSYYPENTMPAFIGAAEMGADWIELDVQESKDGQIFASHDSNFRRLAGISKNVWELTYDEIARIDVGKRFSAEFEGTHPPLLAEALEFARQTGVQLNIEVKPTGHERHLESEVARLITEAGLADQCVVSSQSYTSLLKIKEANSDIQTIYILSLAYGNILELEGIDGYSIEETTITKSLVNRIHRAGKTIAVWTLNSRAQINQMIDFGVDNIVTDDIALARQCISESLTSSTLREYIRMLQ